MARYTLKSFLRQTLNSLLYEFFSQKSLLSDFEWYRNDSSGNRVPLPETEIVGLAGAIAQLGNNDFLAINQEFKQICWMANEDRNFCLIDLARKQKFNIDLVGEFDRYGIEGYFDRSMYVYLHHNDLFNYAVKFMEIVTTESARDFEIGPGLKPEINEESLNKFKQDLIKHYKAKGRGKKCIIDYYHKKGKVDQYCYYIFHEDCVKTVLDFTENGEDLIWRPQRHNFENIFFFEPKTGHLRIHAGGEKNSEQLADIFCMHILRLAGRPNKNTMVYDLSRVKDKEFTFDHKSPIEKIHLKEIICDMGNDEEVTLKVKGREEKYLLLQEKMHAVMKTYGVDPSDVAVVKIKFKVLFKKQENIKGLKSRTKEIELPNKTNISSDDYYDNIIKRHVEHEWKLKRFQLPPSNADEAA